MARVLAVANRTIGSAPFLEVLSQRAAAGDDIFIVVPATRPSDDEAALRASEHVRTWPGESRAVGVARARLRAAVRQLERQGAAVDGDVGVPDPVEAVAQLIAWRPFDEIVLSTMPRSASRWMAMDVPRRLRRRFGLPVTHVEATSVFRAAALEPL